MDYAVDILNRLLNAEGGNLVHRLGEANSYVSWPAAADHALVEKMSADVRRHQRELVDMILSLRGAPAPFRYPTELGGIHYLKLSFLMPQVIASVRRLVETYESVGSTGRPQADALISRILADHKCHLAELERLHANLGAPVA